MEILLLIAVGAVAVFWALNRLNKESYTGSHPLDSLAKDPVVNNKTGDVVDQPVVAQEPQVVEAVTTQITDAVTQSEPVKKTRKPRTPKVEKPVEVIKPVKAVKPVRAAAKKVAVKRSKKA
jgi:PBP1b-binding outer membrane lipoprotein LpoB